MAKEYYCNRCGKKMDEFDIDNGAGLNLTAGYGSVYDCCQIDLDLCCKCMDEIIDSCSISPVVRVRE